MMSKIKTVKNRGTSILLSCLNTREHLSLVPELSAKLFCSACTGAANSLMRPRMDTLSIICNGAQLTGRINLKLIENSSVCLGASMQFTIDLSPCAISYIIPYCLSNCEAFFNT